jgi:preprotein translocase subunit YajC
LRTTLRQAGAGGPRNVAIALPAVIVRADCRAGRRAGPAEKRKAGQGEGESLMLITPAFAQGATAGGSDMLMSLLPFILIFVIMYFLILRPQQKRVKQHQEMVKNVRRGDTVVTSGGLVGKVTKVVDDDQVEVEIADGVRVRQMRSMVAEVRAKGEPVKDEGVSG